MAKRFGPSVGGGTGRYPGTNKDSFFQRSGFFDGLKSLYLSRRARACGDSLSDKPPVYVHRRSSWF